MSAQVLCVGLSDSCAFTGIQADIKVVQALGGYAATAVTAVSIQNTQGIYGVHMIPPDVISEQMRVVVEDMNPAVVKTGALVNQETIDVVSDYVAGLVKTGIRVVVDPVMTLRGGRQMMDKDARDELKRKLLIHADVLTPNIFEAESLTGMTIRDVDDMKHAAEMLLTLGAGAVLVKGGALALSGETVFDVLYDDQGCEVYQNKRVTPPATHGAGTVLSAGIAVGLAQGMDVHAAFSRVRNYLAKAIESGIPPGAGPIPFNLAIDPEYLVAGGDV